VVCCLLVGLPYGSEIASIEEDRKLADPGEPCEIGEYKDADRRLVEILDVSSSSESASSAPG